MKDMKGSFVDYQIREPRKKPLILLQFFFFSCFVAVVVGCFLFWGLVFVFIFCLVFLFLVFGFFVFWGLFLGFLGGLFVVAGWLKMFYLVLFVYFCFVSLFLICFLVEVGILVVS